MSVRQLLSLIQGLDAPIVAADVVELNPRNDPSGVSAFVAAKILRELLGVMIGNGARGTGNREPGTGNRERGTGNKELGTGNREQGTAADS